VPMSVPSGGSGGAVKPLYTNSSTVHYVFPGDFNVIYDVNTIVNAGFTGTGVKVAIIGRSQITNSDVTELEGYAGQSARTPNVVLVPGSANPGLVAGDEDESTLDVGRVLTTATGAQADLVIAAAADGGGITPATEYNVNTLLDPVMTISYGACEPLAGVANVNFANNLFSQAAGEGISTFVSSGDSAAAGCATSFSTPTTTEYVAMGNYLCTCS
jgi:subtilase family serine protease